MVEQEKDHGRRWFIIASLPEGDQNRVKEVVVLRVGDFTSKDEFWKELEKRKRDLSNEYGWMNISTGSGEDFTSFFDAWRDEYIVGGQD